MQKILIVEDDATIALAMAGELKKWGYEVQQVADFANVIQQFRAFAPHLVLMDLSLPYSSGFYWCTEIRRESNLPIIFVSSAADNMNMVTALHQGADDFIAKPFDLPVLVAKVQAILRRAYSFTPEPETLHHKNASLNLNSMVLEYNGQKLHLTRNEYRILQQLWENRGSVVPRDAIIRRLWDEESFIDDNTLTVNINRLRKKLDEIGLHHFIVTKKGEGYTLPAEDNA